MQNNFERTVQQKMEELKLTPSAPVWQKVEMEIVEKKRRRRGIFWILFAALLLGGGWWLYSNKLEKQDKQTTISSRDLSKKNKAQAPQVNERSNETVKNEPTSTQKKTEVSNELIPRQSNTNSPSASSLTLKKINVVSLMKKAALPKQSSNDEAKGGNDLYKSKATAQLRSDNQSKTKSSELNTATSTETPAQKNNATPQKFFGLDSSKLSLKHTDSFSTKLPATTPVQTGTQITVDKTDTITSKQMTREKTTSPQPDTALRRKVAAAGKWRNSIGVNAGWSGYAESSNQSSFAAVNYSSSPSTGSVSAVPSATRAGLHFSVGFLRTKKLGKHWELSTGLQYTFASVYQKVGDKKTSNASVPYLTNVFDANGYYTNTGTTDYTARFHFIELPLSFSFRPSLRLPLYLLAGAAYGRLLSTNALTFSTASNVYYQNNQNYLRNTLPVFTAVQVGLFERKKLSLRTGPFLQYNLLKLRNENTNGVPHFVFAGLNTAINF